MIVQNASRAPTFNQAGLNYDVAPIPIPAGGKRTNNAGGARFVVSSASPNKQAAWTFLSWLQGSAGQRNYVENGDMFPALRSVAESDAFKRPGQQLANRDAFLVEAGSVEFATPGNFPEWDELNESLIEPTMQCIWIGEASPDDVMPALCAGVDAFLRDNGYPN